MRYKITARPFLLPLMSKVVFVDWHNVLCKEVFWFSILQNNKHPYYKELSKACESLFSERIDVVEAWMRGELRFGDIIKLLNIKLDHRCHDDYLHRRLIKDCKRMKIQQNLLMELQKARRNSFVVLATDNMDCFLEAIDTRPELQSVIDTILCSSAMGVLKSESIICFFKPWLDQHKLNFSRAILLDDNESICQRFRSAGGTAVAIKSISQAINILRSWRSFGEQKSAADMP